MQEVYIEFEENLMNDISVKESIEQLKPEIKEMILEEYGDIDTYVNHLENRETACKVFEYISDLKYWKEQKVLVLRFGLIDGQARTREEVAQIMGTTRERIRQIESKCLRRGNYHQVLRRKRLRDFL